ncbi:MAG: mechanosensitive ion channel family protein [Erysipelothrix sp.]|jgi:small-conductance mechanosensitive channel|nr:mechanosensitive ion channel family protein [Erysipelothrix sp.]
MWDLIIEQSNRYLLHGLEGIVVTILILIALIVLLKALIKRLLQRLVTNHVLDQTGARFAGRILKAILYAFVVVTIGAQIIPIKNLSVSLLAGSGIAVLIVGFAAQEAFSNIIAGFFISFFRPYSVGDLVYLPEQDVAGRIEDINLRHTIIRTFKNQAVIIPNNTMNQVTIENRDLVDQRARNYFEILISFDSDLDMARAIMLEEILKHPALLDARSAQARADNEPLVKVILSDLSGYGMLLRATLWSADYSSGWAMMNDLREQVKKRFDAAGIVVPLPSQTVFMKQARDDH